MKKLLLPFLLCISLSAGAIVIQGETSPGVYTNVAATSGGVLTVGGTVTATTVSTAQDATTSGVTGPMVQGSVTTAAPTYTTGKVDPLSLTTTGSLRTSVTDPLPAGTNVIGHAIVDSGVVTTVSAVTAITNALPAGTNSIGKVTPTVPVATTVTIVSLQTNATGTTYNAFGSATCNALDITNNTGTVIEYRRGAAGTAFPIQDKNSRLIIGITNSNAIDLRRTDVSNSQVTVAAECIAN